MKYNGIDERLLYKLWFVSIKGLYRKHRKQIRNIVGSEEELFNMKENDLNSVLPQKLADIIKNSRSLDASCDLYKAYEERDIKILFEEDKEYPMRLRYIEDNPDVLYYRGYLDESLYRENSSIGIVGSRMFDTYGNEIAKKFSYDLAKKNICIVSGLAKGIDSFAHLGALNAKGYTIAVLGCGINVTYPRENVNLFMEIVNNGLVVSEYGLDVPPNQWQFPERNRIISGLSDGILVVEARKKSGSLITADSALEQGKQVYAVPGRLYDTNCEGTNNLIKQGAMCVTDAWDIIDDLRGISEEYGEIPDDRVIEQKEKFLAPSEKKVYSCLSLEPLYIDDIVNQCGFGVSQTISILYNMEEKNMIKQPTRGYYIISV